MRKLCKLGTRPLVTPSTAEEHTVRFHFILSFHFAARHVHNICIHESHIFHENADACHTNIKYQVSSINIKKGMWMANFRATDNFPRPHGRYFHLITMIMIMIMIIKYYWYVLVLVLHVPHCIFNRSCHDPSMVHMKKYWHP